MSINWIVLAPQVPGLATHTALQQAELGAIPWTGPLVREWNRRWLTEHAPDLLAKIPGAIEEAQCKCGGWCRVGGVDEAGLLQRCTQCGASYRVTWSAYGGRHAL